MTTTALVAANDNVRSFYVYQHRRNDTGEVFYVGKGSGNRAWSTGGRNAHWRRVVEKNGYSVEIICDDIDEDFAFLLECEMIAKIGRRNKRTGSLINLTDGGEGSSGTVFSEETRAKIAEANRNRSPETIEKLRAAATGKKRAPFSAETRAKMSAAKRGMVHSEAARTKMSASRAGVKRGPLSEGHKSKLRTINLEKSKSLGEFDKIEVNGRNNLFKNNTSGYMNIYFVKSKNKWAARISSPRRKIPGYYSTKEEAMIARDSYINVMKEG